MRPVLCFVNLDKANQDVHDRGDCVLFDLHGLWWSVPTELTIRQINAQIASELDRLGCQRFRQDPWRPALRVVPHG